MYSKLTSDSVLFDHELLEILLYNAYPRMNTNPVAHALLDKFCSLTEVLGASVEELTSVNGVGESVALYLKCVGVTAARAGCLTGFAELKTHGDVKRFCSVRMACRSEEMIGFFLLGKDGMIKRILEYTSHDKASAVVPVAELVKEIAASRPYALIAAHNHPDGDVTPSAQDDVFTRQVQCICALNDVVFYDHCICGGADSLYSYSDSGVLDAIKREISLDSVMNIWTTKTR